MPRETLRCCPCGAPSAGGRAGFRCVACFQERERARGARHRARKAAEPSSVRACETCGGTFDVSPLEVLRPAADRRRFCSATCRRVEVACTVCGARYLARAGRGGRCSEECRRQHNRERIADYLRRYREEHGVSYHAAKYPEKRRAYAQARRARIRGNESEVFDAREVFDRDGWVCGVCSDPIDPALSWPDPRSVSLDHYPLPVALGGPHTRENTRAAHLGCNSAEGAEIREVRRELGL